nr:hypothetical protein [Burkholderia pyrrocinia]
MTDVPLAVASLPIAVALTPPVASVSLPIAIAPVVPVAVARRPNAIEPVPVAVAADPKARTDVPLATAPLPIATAAVPVAVAAVPPIVAGRTLIYASSTTAVGVIDRDCAPAGGVGVHALAVSVVLAESFADVQASAAAAVPKGAENATTAATATSAARAEPLECAFAVSATAVHVRVVAFQMFRYVLFISLLLSVFGCLKAW